ncbi:Uncharacterized protein TPAR_04999 [Tolypocladium paradoxum]|uniref:Uncharacterized protein n=1 Tax=Tolypocladium paradoxum TaxID=94208 RepID=A0A2S4KX85_9HYPO|nr:Uncharacterized protein TPAR_04999 [Tolypocladium paradoxum]
MSDAARCETKFLVGRDGTIVAVYRRGALGPASMSSTESDCSLEQQYCIDRERSTGKMASVSVYGTPLMPVVDNSTAKKASAKAGLPPHAGLGAHNCRAVIRRVRRLYNPAKNLCATLAPGQRVCCSGGTLPDITRKPKKNGTCAHGQAEGFNDKTTWGWSRCNNLAAGINICLSKVCSGTPPLPAPVPNAVCGPTKPGSGHPGLPGYDADNLHP